MLKHIIRREPTTFLSESLSPLLKKIYSARGITNESELQRQLKGLHHYTSLKGIEKTATILADAITGHKSILIVGDFDCDGATSSALGVLAIKAMGGTVNYLVPNRFEYGYGLTPES